MTNDASVLLVDDDALVRSMARELLISYGYTVVEAGSGTVAVEKFRSDPGRFGVVLLDMVMPGLTGMQTLERLRKIDPQVKVVFWSAYPSSEEDRKIIESGAYRFLQKPDDLDRLIDTVAGAIESRGSGDR